MIKQLIMYYLMGLGYCFNYSTYMRSAEMNISRMIYEPESGSGWPLIKQLCIYIRTFYYISCVYKNNTEASTVVENLMKNGGPSFIRNEFSVSKIMVAYNWEEETFINMQGIFLTVYRLWFEIDCAA